MSAPGTWVRLPCRIALLGLLAVAACSSGGGSSTRGAGGPPETFEPLVYDYLTPIRLNVASVDIEPRVTLSASGRDVTAQDPAQPVATITRMARDRLQALGPSGRAVLIINDASIVRQGDNYEGSFAVELDIYTSANVKAAFAEARVSGRRSVDSSETTQRALYELTKTLMDQLNVELEYQVRRAMKDWLLAPPSSEAPAVEQQALPPPPGATASPVPPDPALPNLDPDAGPSLGSSSLGSSSLGSSSLGSSSLGSSLGTDLNRNDNPGGNPGGGTAISLSPPGSNPGPNPGPTGASEPATQ